MKTKLKNTSGYNYGCVDSLIRLARNLHDQTRAKLRGMRKTVTFEVVPGRDRVGIKLSGRLVRLTLPKPRALDPQHLDRQHSDTALRLLRWAHMQLAGYQNKDMNEDQLCCDGPVIVHGAVYFAEVRWTGPSKATPEGKLARHLKAIARQKALIEKWSKKKESAEHYIAKYQRSLSALQASTHRIGKPAGTRAPSAMTPEQIAELDAAFID